MNATTGMFAHGMFAHARVAVIAVMCAAPAWGQVKAAFPGPRRADSPTPLERSMPAPSSPGAPSPSPTSGAARGAVVVGPHSRTGAVVTGSGLTVDGSFSNDNVNVAFHLGAQPTVAGNRIWYPGGECWYYPYSCYGGWGWYNRYYSRYYNGYYDNSNQRYAVIDGALVQTVSATLPASPAPSAPPAAPLTDAQAGAALLKAGDADGAIERYRAALRADGTDSASMRGLAIALLVKGEPEQGVAMMSMAYRTDPTLADSALPARDLFGSDTGLRRALQQAVALANKHKSASSWLTVAVLMQAEGRTDHARRMIDRAADLGLDEEIAKRFRTSLGG